MVKLNNPPALTVRELIEELKKYDPEKVVSMFDHYTGELTDITSVGVDLIYTDKITLS